MSAREAGNAGRERDEALSEETAWALLLACARHRREGHSSDGLAVDRDGQPRETVAEDPESALAWQAGQGWRVRVACSPAARELFDLYLPLCRRTDEPPLALAHLGQSLDGFIATAGGDSCYVNDQPDLVHLHRLRALCDAVVVGAGTVACDDPRLTTRLVPGDSPVRVVIDPRGRLTRSRRVFEGDEARTLVVRSVAGHTSHPRVERVDCVPGADGRLEPAAVLALLRERGLHTVFVEGGGVTVSRFYAAGVLDRLQIAVAPLIIGEGRGGLRLPGSDRLSDCARPRARVFHMGADVLFDLDLRAEAACAGSDASAGRLPATTTTP